MSCGVYRPIVLGELRIAVVDVGATGLAVCSIEDGAGLGSPSGVCEFLSWPRMRQATRMPPPDQAAQTQPKQRP
jgi:hypothetical protein